ncbi:hypothetical protein GCM10010347_51040 [Streptomyces cirratus]|uniref:Uncharacterized protein n=1 Tax=Streptomyces cirratus TaxID=68187 RepID=A0ABQ3F4J5_9ACTN|nr:hypothetical protein [Streptomyces cirratus]GHB74433.1 hypothetical protein GCM10010347_51040 [Streptomyces cirratus]
MAPGPLVNRGYTCGIVVALVFFASFTGLVLVLSLFLQGPLGLSPQGAGYASPPWPPVRPSMTKRRATGPSVTRRFGL